MHNCKVGALKLYVPKLSYIFNLFANEVFKEHPLRFCLPVNVNLNRELLGEH